VRVLDWLANMDVRSSPSNYETNLVIYDEGVTRELEADFLADVQRCEAFSAERYDERPFPARLGDSVMRLFSPLL